MYKPFSEEATVRGVHAHMMAERDPLRKKMPLLAVGTATLATVVKRLRTR